MAFELMATFSGWQEENQPFKTGNGPVTDTITAVKEKDNQPVHRLQFNSCEKKQPSQSEHI